MSAGHLNSPNLLEMRNADLLRAIDTQFALQMGELAGERRADVLLAAAMTSANLGAGHVCLNLAGLAGRSVQYNDAHYRFPSFDNWVSSIASSPLVSDGSQHTPLVLDDQNHLYLRRYWLHEQCLARTLLDRAKAAVPVDPKLLQKGLNRLFGDSTLAQDQQRLAALMSVTRRFSVVSGGPGTGKTFTVVKILALLVEQARAANQTLRMTLMAPTGKAAARLVESIVSAKANLDCTPDVLAAIAEQASTIHRALGSRADSNTRFVHDQRNPLLTDLVLVDEASMVNLALMSRLLAAIPDHAQLILLGDKDQLASVEAGSVMADICQMTKERSVILNQQIEDISGETLQSTKDAPKHSGIWDCVTHLNTSYRYRAGSGIEALAKAINCGDADTAIDVLNDDAFPDVRLAAVDRSMEHLLQQAKVGYQRFLAARSPLQALGALSDFRVLCAHHEGNNSVSAINAKVGNALSHHTEAGQPILIGVNDYDVKLYNGDIGVLMHEDGQLRASFIDEQSTDAHVRTFSRGRLPKFSPVYAMSIHKSQGSEFSDIAIVLPEQMSEVLNRELLYTAVTRAKESLTVYADLGVLRECIERRTLRESGLHRLLWQVGETEQGREVTPTNPGERPQELAERDTSEKQNALMESDAVEKQSESATPATIPTEDTQQAEPFPLHAQAAESPAPTTPKPPQWHLLAQEPEPKRKRRHTKPKSTQKSAMAQLAFNLDEQPTPPKAVPPKRLRKSIQPLKLDDSAANCCGGQSDAHLRCPRCAHIWVVCCRCSESE